MMTIQEAIEMLELAKTTPDQEERENLINEVIKFLESIDLPVM